MVIVHGRNANNYYLYAMVCIISGTSITPGTDTELSSNVGTGRKISAVALSENKIFVTHMDTNFKLFGIACTISGMTISKGTDTQLSSLLQSGDVFSSAKLSENKVVIAHCATEYYHLYGVVCIITGTTINVATDTVLSTEYSGRTISIVALNAEKVLILHNKSTNNYLYRMLCAISNTSITAGMDIQLSSVAGSGFNISAVKLNEALVFIVHGNTDLLGMTLDYFLNLVKKVILSEERIDGVAITGGQAGELVTTVRPDDILEMKLNATISTENYGSITWENEVVTIRKHNTDNTYYTYKTINIEGINYNFSFALFYGEGTTTDKGTKISCIFSPNLYTDSTRFSGSVNWVSTFENSTNRSTDLYTEPNKLGEKITINASVEKIN